MGKSKSQHVVPNDSGWAVKKGGSSKATTIVQTQEKAIEIAKGIAKQQGAELFIHGRDGKIRERNSYGNDSFPPKG
jgi:hypothetical protein